MTDAASIPGVTVEKLQQRLANLHVMKEQLANAYQQTVGKIELVEFLIGEAGKQPQNTGDAHTP